MRESRLRLPIYLKPYEVRTLLNATEDLRDLSIFRLFYYCALRVSEALGLRIEDIDPAERMLRVCHALTPSGLPEGGRERLVPIDTETLRLIQAYVGNRSLGRVFDIGIRHIQRIIKRQARAAKIRDPERVTPHKLRHSFAVHWIQRGGDLERLRRILGHRSLDTTQVYLQFQMDDIKREYNRIMSVQGV